MKKALLLSILFIQALGLVAQHSNITISGAATSGGAFAGGEFTPTADNANINAAALVTQLQGTANVTINTACGTCTQTGNVTFSADVVALTTGTTGITFTVTANGNVIIDNLIDLTPSGAGGTNNTARPGISFTVTSGGNIEVKAAVTTTGNRRGNNTSGGNGGNINLKSNTGNIKIAAALSANGANGGNSAADGSGGNIIIDALNGITLTSDLSSIPGNTGVTPGTRGNVIFTNGSATVTTGGVNDGQTGGVINVGNFSKTGAGTLLLSGTNTYTGTTTITGGAIRVTTTNVVASTNGPLGNSATAIILNGGAIESGVGTFSRDISLTAGGSRIDAFGSARTVSSNINGGFSLNVGGTFVSGETGQALTLSGVISDITGLTKTGTSTVVLTNANTFTTGVTLDEGTLVINNSAALGTAAGTFSINGGTIDNTSGSEITTNNHPIAIGGSFVFTGSNNLILGNGDISSDGNYSITCSGGALTLGGEFLATNRDLTKAGAGILNLEGDVELNSFTIGGGTLNCGNSFGVRGVLTLTSGTINTNDTLVLRSVSNSSYGQIAPGGSGTLNGLISVEKTVANTNAGWREMCFPVTEPLFKGIGIKDASHSVESQMNIFYWDARDTATVGEANGWKAPYVSMIQSGIGYNVYSNNSNPSLHALQSKFAVTGEAVSGNLPRINLLETSYDFVSIDPTNIGWNLVGNPYPSNFDLTTFLNDNGNFVSTYRSVQIWNGSNYDGLDASDNAILAPFQGFWVQVDAGDNGFIDFSNSYRTTSSATNIFYKRNPNVFSLSVIDGDGRHDKLSINFEAGATEGFEGDMDISKRLSQRNDVPTIYTTTTGRKLYKNSLPESNEYSIPVHFESKFNNLEYTFNAITDRYVGGQTVTLEDKKTGVFHNILEAVYTFKHDTKYSTDRFVLHFNYNGGGSNVSDIPSNAVQVGSNGTDAVIVLQGEYPLTGKYEITNLMGQKVLTGLMEFQSGTNLLNLDTISSGIYVLHIEGVTGGYKIMKK